jgi:hypothetical protein
VELSACSPRVFVKRCADSTPIRAAAHFNVRRENILLPIKEHGLPMADKDIPHENYGSWRIIETSLWFNDNFDILGTALISLTRYDD